MSEEEDAKWDGETLIQSGPALLKEMMTYHKEFAFDLLKDGTVGKYIPHLTIITFSPECTDDDKCIERSIVCLNIPFNTAEEKRGVMRKTGELIAKARKVPIAFAISSEAWVSHQVLAEGEKPKFKMPADDPDRKEVVVLFGNTIDGANCQASQLEINRDAKNMIVPDGWFGLPKELLRAGFESPLLEAFRIGFLEEAKKMILKHIQESGE